MFVSTALESGGDYQFIYQPNMCTLEAAHLIFRTMGNAEQKHCHSKHKAKVKAFVKVAWNFIYLFF